MDKAYILINTKIFILYLFINLFLLFHPFSGTPGLPGGIYSLLPPIDIFFLKIKNVKSFVSFDRKTAFLPTFLLTGVSLMGIFLDIVRFRFIENMEKKVPFLELKGENMLRTLRISFMLMTVLLLIAGHASAAGYTWRLTNTPADWTSANWGDGANYPGAGDTATIGRKYYGNPATVNVTGSEAATYVNLGTNDVTSDGTLNIKNGGSLAVFYSTVGANGTGEINIEAGGTMTFSGTYHTTYIASGVGTTGTVNIQGAYEVGNLRIGDAGTGSTYISGNGSLTIDATRSVYIGYASGSTGLLEVSDSGTFDGVNLFIGNDVASDATFRVVGGDATLSLSSVLDMDQGAGTYEVHLDDTGISTLAVTGQARFGVSGGIIAPTALAGAQAGTYTVMTYDNYTGSPVLQDATGNWSMDVGATELTLTYVPEPTTMMLLGLGGLAMLKRRRK